MATPWLCWLSSMGAMTCQFTAGAARWNWRATWLSNLTTNTSLTLNAEAESFPRHEGEMRTTTTTMERNVDTTGWATFGTVMGMLTAGHELTQFLTAIGTLAVGIVLAHFLKRELQYRFPPKKREEAE